MQRSPVSVWQIAKDRLCFPLLAFLSSEQARSFGLTPIDDERTRMALTRCRGLVLDLGCGTNRLLAQYRLRHGRGVGVDVYPWPGADIVCDTTGLPFPDLTFDTVAMLACLNHVPLSKRHRVLQECRRILKDEGALLITMINPLVGFVVHGIRYRHDPDQLERGMGPEEAYGMWPGEIRSHLASNGFRIVEAIPFVFGLNRLYVSRKTY